MFFTYILYSNTLGRYYTGQTNDLNRRLQEHNTLNNRFTSKGQPWILVYSEDFESRSEAVAVERKIKKRGARRFLLGQGITPPA